MRPRQIIVAVALVIAVALAFADASVVALALPDLYAEFDTTIVGVSWVLITYALVVAVVAIPVALLHRWLRPLPLVVAGIVVFTAASLVAGCGRLAAGPARRARARRGRSDPAARRLPPGAHRDHRRRGAGPALVGGRRPRSAPPSARPSAACSPSSSTGGRSSSSRRRSWPSPCWSSPSPRPARSATRGGCTAGRGPRARDVVSANVGFALVFAALVGALFLGVLLAIEVWRYSPIQGGAADDRAPLGMLLGRTPAARPGRSSRVGGALLLAGGTGRARPPPRRAAVFAGIALALCGVGFDLVGDVLGPAAVPPDAPAVRAATVSVGARHAGLVLGSC